MKPTRSVLLGVLIVVLFAIGLAVLACGGEETTTTTQVVTSTTHAATTTTLSTTTTTQTVTTTQTATTTGTTTLPAPTVAGTIAFARVVGVGNTDICAVNTDGTGLKPLADTPGWEEDPSWSPDGSRIVYAAYPPGNLGTETASVWIMNADGSAKAQLSKGNGFGPVWSPDGKQIVYASFVSIAPVQADIFLMNADGSGAKNLTGTEGTDTEGLNMSPSWAPNGEILFLRDGDLYSMNPAGLSRAKLTTGLNIGEYALSPDGDTLAYCDRNTKAIATVSLEGGGAPVTLLEPGGQFITDDPLAALSWTPDGKVLAVASSSLGGFHGSLLYIINVDGTGLSAVPGIETADDPAWRPE